MIKASVRIRVGNKDFRTAVDISDRCVQQTNKSAAALAREVMARLLDNARLKAESELTGLIAEAKGPSSSADEPTFYEDWGPALKESD